MSMGGGGAGMYEGIAGGTLGGIGDIVNAATHKNLKAPPATNREQRLRQMTMQDLMQAQQLYGAGAGYYNQSLPMMYNAIPGIQAQMEYDPQAQAEFGQAYSAVGDRIKQVQDLQNAQAGLRQARQTKGSGRKAAVQQAQAALKAVKQRGKGQPSFDELNRALQMQETRGPQMRLSAKAPTQTDQNAQQIQDALSNRTLTALRGGLANPMLEQQLGLQQKQMEGQMEQNLGPDWQTSTAGIQARDQFNQYANAQRDASNRADISQLYPEQLGGQQAGYGFAGSLQQLLGQPAMNEANMGTNLGNFTNQLNAAQQPNQFDRQMQMGVNAANWGYGNPWGTALQQSGNRWIQASGSGGGGGGGGSMPAAGGGGGGGMNFGSSGSF